MRIALKIMALKIVALKIVALKIAAPLLAAALTLAACPAEAETIDVSDSHGGSVAAYDAEWAGRARAGSPTNSSGCARRTSIAISSAAELSSSQAGPRFKGAKPPYSSGSVVKNNG
jgi:hypothetical protein